MLKVFRLLIYYPLYTMAGGIILLFTIIINYILIKNSSEWAVLVLTISTLAWFYFFTSIHPQSRLHGQIISRIEPTKNSNMNNKIAYLTFDDGPNIAFTSQLLRILSNYGVKATFFLVGENIMRAPDMVKRILEEGHSIGNHSFNHSTLILRGKRYIITQVEKCEDIIISTGGKKPYLFRFPHGFRDFRSIRIVRGLGYKIVSWSVMPMDWLSIDAEKIERYVISNTSDGDIILLHDGYEVKPAPDRSQMMKALPHIIEGLKKRGFTFKRLEDVIDSEK